MPQALTTIASLYTDPSLTPVAGVPVVATLMGTSLNSGIAVIREEKTRTNLFGQWSLSLIPNVRFNADESASYYIIRVGGKESYEVFVPEVETLDPVELTTILRKNTTTIRKSVFTGDMVFDGNVFIRGDLRTSGSITAQTIVSNFTAPTLQTPTFYNTLEVFGDLVVAGTLRVSGKVTAGEL